MNRKYLFPCLTAILLLAPAAFAQTTIAQWTFETSIPTTAGPLSPEVGSGSATGLHAGASTYSNPVGNGSAESWSSTAWAVGDYWQFQVSATGYQNIAVSYDQTSSGTGPGQFYLAYSTDGINFTVALDQTNTVQVNSSPNPFWNGTTASTIYTTNYDLSAIAALNNAATVYFRLVDASTVSASGGTVAGGGTSRIDNFTVSGVSGAASPPSLAIQLAGTNVILTWNDPTYSLESSTNVAGPYTFISQLSPYPDAITNTANFYRLIK